MKILCFGDSNTYGYDPRSCFGSRYPAQSRWVDLLGTLSGYETVNAGENGREIPIRESQKKDFFRLLEREASVDLLIIMLGTNDLLQGAAVTAVTERMRAFLERIPMDRPGILVIGPPPMQLGQWVPDRHLTDSARELNDRYRALCRDLDIPFADAGEWNVPLAFDGVHFTEEGHRTFAKGLGNFLKERSI